MAWLWTLIVGCLGKEADVGASRWVEELPAGQAEVSHLQIGPDGAVYAAAWGVLRRGEEGWQVLPGSEDQAWRSIAFDADGTLFASGRSGRILRGQPGALQVDRAEGALYDLVQVTAAAGQAWASAAGSEIWSWDGNAWTAAPVQGFEDRSFGAMWAADANHLFASAHLRATGKPASIALRQDGAWRTWELGRNGQLPGLTGTSASDVWAVGYTARLLGKGGQAFHWDGAAWTETKLPVDQPLYGVFARAPGEAWAVGAQGTLLRWDGLSWSRVPTGLSEPLSGIAVTADGTVFVIARSTRVLRWTGEG